MIRKALLLVLTLSAVNLAHAGVINFTSCFARCAAVDAVFGDDLGILATLEYTDNGAGGLDFVLTHSFSNSYTPAEDTYISELFLNFATAPTGFSDLTNNIASIDVDPGNIINAGLTFDGDIDLKDSNRRRLLDGQTASWTFLGVSEADVIGTGLVHIRDLPLINLSNEEAGDQVKVVGTPTVVQSVPEPAGFLLLGIGLGLLGRRVRQSAS